MDVFIYEPITAETAGKIVQELRALDPSEEMDVHINSPGGNVFAGFAIYNSLKSSPNTINIYIDGLAASVASVIAMAGDTIYMSESSQIMVHNSRIMFGGGSAKQLEKQIETLDKIDNQLINIYHARTGLSVDKLRQLLEDESFLSADEAKSFGFADMIIENKKIAAFYNKFNDMEKSDLLKGIKALNVNLFGDKEEKSEEVKAEAEKIKEKTQKEVSKEEEARKEKLEGVETLTAEMVPHAQYSEDMSYLKNGFKLMLEFIAGQPEKDEIKQWIESTGKDYFNTLIKQVKSETQVPRPSNNFEEVVNDKDEEHKANWDYALERKKELEEANAK